MTMPENNVVLVTGPSGAGRATAIRALEDLGFEAIDNMPLRLLPRLLDGGPPERPLALGIDARNRDFAPEALLGLQASLRAKPDMSVSLLFLDCRRDVLLRRFSETRRRHPMAPDEAPEEGIAREFALLGPVKAQADIVIDTSEFSPHDLKAELYRWFPRDVGGALSVLVQSFSYKRGVPQGVDLVFDCRFLANPHWEPGLREKTGLDGAVATFLERDPRLAPFIAKVTDLLTFLLPAYVQEGKTHVSVGFGCTGGQHRSVAVSRFLYGTLAQAGWQVSIRHRELERRGLAIEAPDDAPETGRSQV